jgi:hypothetical protein
MHVGVPVLLRDHRAAVDLVGGNERDRGVRAVVVEKFGRTTGRPTDLSGSMNRDAS